MQAFNIVCFCSFVAIVCLYFETVQCILQNQIHVAAIFDQLGDRKHELAFKYGIEKINRDPAILPGVRINPQVIRIPPRDR